MNTYQKGQIEYIQTKISKIRNSVEDRQSWFQSFITHDAIVIENDLSLSSLMAQLL